jgi:hypothetical protein
VIPALSPVDPINTPRAHAKIKERSKEANKIDDYISKRVENDIRMQIHKVVKLYVDRIITYGLKNAHQNQISDRNSIVLSEYQVLPCNRRGHYQTCVSDDLILPSIQGNEQAWKIIDTKDRRFLYLNEFESRCNTLLEVIKDGLLDQHLSEAPHELVHKIMGQKGELLQTLDIEPKEGSTYKRITRIIALT